MAINVRDYVNKLSDESKKRIDKEAELLISREVSLRELRKARLKSQEELAVRLHVKQSSISKLERRTDIYIHTLKSYIEAMGGDLQIIAKFPDSPPIRINQFHDIQQS